MFIDKKSKKLIQYLSENEPQLDQNKNLIYVVPSLLSAVGIFLPNDEKQVGHLKDSLIPYLEKLKETGYIIQYDFISDVSVKIVRSVHTEFWKEYRIHRIAHSYLIPFVVSLATALFVQLIQLMVIS